MHGPVPGALVVKLGGRALEAPGALPEFAAALREAALGGRSARATLVLHGGGAEVTQWCARMGIESSFADGLRVTDRDTLEVVTAVLAGLANKRLVAALRAGGLDAFGMSLLDGGIVRAKRHANANVLGEVGEVVTADATLLRTLISYGRTPVLASLADDSRGALLNINADDAAAAVAAALPASELVLLSDTPGLKLDGEIVRSLTLPQLNEALASPQVVGGMRPKLRAARAALIGGVARVHIAAWQGPATLRELSAGHAMATTIHATQNALREESHV